MTTDRLTRLTELDGKYKQLTFDQIVPVVNEKQKINEFIIRIIEEMEKELDEMKNNNKKFISMMEKYLDELTKQNEKINSDI